VNDPIDQRLDRLGQGSESVKERWTKHGVRWGTFKIMKVVDNTHTHTQIQDCGGIQSYEGVLQTTNPKR
jgi:hypothetical protein